MSNFRKRQILHKPIAGTRTSPQTGQVITSSGNPSLDVILGGGLPIGSICLIEEDKFRTHSKVLAKYFLAEGIFSQQAVFFGSLDDEPNELLRKLPRPLTEQEMKTENADEAQNEEAPKNGLRIAWRYNDLPLVNSEQTMVKIGHDFNLLEQISSLTLHYADTTTWNGTESANTCGEEAEDSGEDESSEVRNYTENTDNQGINDQDIEMKNEAGDAESLKTVEKEVQKSEEENSSSSPTTAGMPKLFENDKYSRISYEIHGTLREDKFTNGLLGQKSLCRVCITSLGSPLWFDEHFEKDILKFLTVLRAIVRSASSVCFITMPMHLVAKYDTNLVSKIRNLVDYSIELESFAGSERETHPAFKEYNGLLHLRKVAAINTLSAYLPETSDLAFKLRRKKFVIEKLHLPPELQENNNDAADADIKPTISCGSSVSTNPKSTLDF